MSASQVATMIKRGNATIRAAAAKGAIRGAQRGRALMAKRTPVDQGQLKASWRVITFGTASLDKRGGGIAKVILAELRNTAPHAGIVELGARPHKVSPEGWAAIYEWARRHFVEVSRGRDGQRRERRIGGDTGEDQWLSELTWAIVKKIEREGQKPTYFVRDSLEALSEIMDVEVAKAVAAAKIKPISKKAPKGGG